MDIKIIIPARYESSRFPGKPLVEIDGEAMIRRVYKNCCSAFFKQDVYVATDSEIIEDYCKSNEMNVIMTSSDCLTGTDRVYEASEKLDADLIVNVQGDLPLIYGESIRKIINSALKEPNIIHYGMNSISKEEDFRSFSVVKVVTDMSDRLLYASRSPIPITKKNVFKGAKKTASVFVLPKETLWDFAHQENKTPLESIEDVEILRFVELGYKVQMVEIEDLSISVDTPEDLEKVKKYIKK